MSRVWGRAYARRDHRRRLQQAPRLDTPQFSDLARAVEVSAFRMSSRGIYRRACSRSSRSPRLSKARADVSCRVARRLPSTMSCGESMNNKPSIGDFVTTDDSGGFLNLKTGDVFDVATILRLYSRAEVLQVPPGRRPVHRRPRQVGRPTTTTAPPVRGAS
jgi:hypothetical protein